MTRPAFELAQIIREYRNSFIANCNPLKHHQRVLNAIEKCRTAALGGHIDQCTDCNHIRISYNSCRNRHCPKCQAVNRERWILQREKDLLPTSYFHVVFTLPQELNSFCLKHPVELYNMLFTSCKETLFVFGNDQKHLGAQMGFIALLHTWGQNLSLHPHLHCIVPGGGFTSDDKWKNARSNGSFLFPVKAMSIVFKNKFMQKLKMSFIEKKMHLEPQLRKTLYNKNWVVYAKQPFLGPEQVIEYLGRYSHKIAISNHRIKSIDGGKVSFSYKDYADANKTKIMSLTANEFLRRFCMHILPPKFMKIRHYGFLANRSKYKLRTHQQNMGLTKQKSNEKAEKSPWKEIAKEKLNFDVEKCPCCKTGKMITIFCFDANAPPATLNFINQLMKRQNKIPLA